MKAVDPVIATLVLIAIAVIAGVFILRQFLTMTNVGSQQFIQVQDAVFYMQRSTDGTKMSITLLLSVKNQADRSVYITMVKVPDLAWNTTLTDVSLRPGDTWTQSFVVAQNVAYSPYWESGNAHTVVIYFKVYGQTEEQSVSISAGVRG